MVSAKAAPTRVVRVPVSCAFPCRAHSRVVRIVHGARTEDVEASERWEQSLGVHVVPGGIVEEDDVADDHLRVQLPRRGQRLRGGGVSRDEPARKL